jgi:FeS assembly SUF system protein
MDEKRIIEAQVIETIRGIYDPEIPVNIYDLGLIYEIKVADNKDIYIQMTLTAPNCPVAESLPIEVRERVSTIGGAGRVTVDLVLDPPWTMDLMTDAAKLDLGML